MGYYHIIVVIEDNGDNTVFLGTNLLPDELSKIEDGEWLWSGSSKVKILSPDDVVRINGKMKVITIKG